LKRNETAYFNNFLYRNETMQCSEQIYYKTSQYQNEKNEIVLKLHSIEAKRTGLFSNLVISKRNERTYFKTA
jgi:hypothetical protein